MMKQKKKKKQQNIYSANNALNEYIRESKHYISNNEFEDFSNILTTLKINNPHLKNVSMPYLVDFTSTAIKKRKEAYNKFSNEIVDKCLLDLQEDISEDIIKDAVAMLISAVPAFSFNRLDKDDRILYSTAVWMLEQFVKQDKLNEIYPYLKDNKKYTSDNFTHPFLSEKLIRATMNVIRNKDGKNNAILGFGNVYHELSNKEKIIAENTEERKDWQTILSLLGNDTISEAVEYFKSKFWEHIKAEIIFTASVLNFQSKQHQQFEKEEDEKLEQLLNFLKLHNPECAKKVQSITNPNKRNRMLLSSCYVINREYVNNISSVMSRKQNKQVEINEMCHDALTIDLFDKKSRKEIFEELNECIPEDIQSYFNELHVENLGKISFAIIYLLYTEDPFIWLYNGTIGVLRQAANDALTPPPAQFNNVSDWKLEDPTDNNVESEEDVDVDNEIEKLANDMIPDNITKLLTLKAKEIFYASPNVMQSLAGMNNVDLGNLTVNINAYNRFINEVVCPETEKEKEYLSCLLQIFIKTNIRENIPSYDEYLIQQLQQENIELQKKISAQNTKKSEEKPKQQEFKPDEIKNLNKRIKQLENQLHKANKETKIAQEEKEEIEKENKLQKQELGSLRELIFDNQNEQLNNQSEPSKEYSFPYRTSDVVSHIVCYGGHKSWLKSMKEMLPDVTFVDAETAPNPALFKGADVIWFQTNKMGHNAFEIIINIAKNNNIPIKYFYNAGPQKCAEQFVDVCVESL